MNRKGMVFFGILLVILLGAGISVMVNYTFQAGETKGVWALSFIRATQEAEKDLLLVDSKAQETAKKVEGEIPSLVFKEDLGCGQVQEVPLWNQKERFCPLKLEEKFTKKFNSLFDEQGLFKYTLSFQEQELVGKTNLKKEVAPATKGVIPTEERNAGLLTFYEAYLIKPFNLRYDYNPSFRAKVNLSLPFYAELEQQAHLLIRKCQNKIELKSCLDQHQNESWNYGKCNFQKYIEENRQVIFCVNNLNFALDFSPQTIFSPRDIQVSFQGNQVKVSFTPLTEAESYNLYYTNWNYQPEDYPQEAKSLFFASQGDYFYAIKTLSNPLEENCPTEREANTAYHCSSQILYWLEDPLIIPGKLYYLAVTAVKNEEESLVYEVLKLDSSGS